MLKTSLVILSVFVLAISFGQSTKPVTQKVSKNLTLSGDWCSGDLTLTANFKSDGNYSWFKNDVLIEGEHDNTLNLTKYGQGNYQVSLRIKENTVLLRDWYELTTVAGPQSSFSFDYFYAAGAVRFFDSSVDQSSTITTWAWDFGNGTTASIKNPEVFYGAEGDYLVTLTTTNANGCSNTIKYTVHWAYPKK